MGVQNKNSRIFHYLWGRIQFEHKKILMLNRITSAILVVSAIVFGSLVAHSGDFVDFSPAKEFIELDAYAIAGTSNVIQNYSSEFPQIQNLSVNMGASLGLGARAVFGFREYLGLGTSLNLMVNNYSVDMAVLGSDNRSMSSVYIDNQFYSLNIPVFMSFRFNIDKSVRWVVDGGFYYAYGFAGTQKQHIYRAEMNAMNELVPQLVSIKTDYFHSHETFINSFNRGDIGLHIATQMNFGSHFIVGIQYQLGLKNSSQTYGISNPSVHNQYLHAKVGYRF